MKFSVLISVYYKEKSIFLDRALSSIWYDQSVKPSQIVLVCDGVLTDELYECISKWQNILKDMLNVVKLERNFGLADALCIGLNECKYELVARMDSDDVSVPDRFKKQIEFFKTHDVDVCGGCVAEFDTDENCIYAYKKVPQNHDEIVIFAKFRNPINHPSVMFKKSSVFAVNSYERMLYFEDYYLWVKMIMQKMKFYNMKEVLVKMRAGQGQLNRRGGGQYALCEFKFLKRLHDIGFLKFHEFVLNATIKFAIRIMPKVIIKRIYLILRE